LKYTPLTIMNASIAEPSAHTHSKEDIYSRLPS
jgi:hypothetical protein